MSRTPSRTDPRTDPIYYCNSTVATVETPTVDLYSRTDPVSDPVSDPLLITYLQLMTHECTFFLKD